MIWRARGVKWREVACSGVQGACSGVQLEFKLACSSVHWYARSLRHILQSLFHFLLVSFDKIEILGRNYNPNFFEHQLELDLNRLGYRNIDYNLYIIHFLLFLIKVLQGLRHHALHAGTGSPPKQVDSSACRPDPIFWDPELDKLKDICAIDNCLWQRETEDLDTFQRRKSRKDMITDKSIKT